MKYKAMENKLYKWLKDNKRDIKSMIIGGIVVALYFVFIGGETGFGIIGNFLFGMFLTALLISAYRLWKKWFK